MTQTMTAAGADLDDTALAAVAGGTGATTGATTGARRRRGDRPG